MEAAYIDDKTEDPKQALRLRRRLFHILHKPSPDNPAAKYANYILALIIVVNCIAVALETLPGLHRYRPAFVSLEVVSSMIFVVEYLMRLWVCVEQASLSSPIAGRLRYMLQPLPLLDLIVLLTVLAPVDLRFLRVFRLTRLLKVLHLDGFDASLKAVVHAVVRRRTMLVVAVTMMLIAIYCSAAILFFVEHHAQPEKFSSIPATLWWAVETLTTIGYGDMYPVTTLGKFCASILSVFGVGVFALPSAILTAAILDATHDEHAKSTFAGGQCPHCLRNI